MPNKIPFRGKLRSLKEVEEIALAYRELCLPQAGW